MVRVFFPASVEGGGAAAPRRFFARPPLGFALVAFPHVGYLIALEWVGVLFVSPITAPFFIGSAEHLAAIAALPDARFSEPEAVDEALTWLTYPPLPGTRAPPPAEAVSWAIAHGRFRKILRADARSPARFRALYDAYARLAELAVDAVATPALRAVALGVRLLFGAHEVLIDMAALSGARDAEDAEVTGAGSVLDAAAAGVAWLASRRLLYVDLRGPNVLVAGREVWLVDFDDCIVLPAPVCDVGAFRYALSKTDAAAMGDWASEFVRGALPEVDVALARAFAALEP